ncbi:uncharacterized protein [Musca autumnalis]|uniref:uncharacterized protein n=1 Tax=Musca autumnalis TaxID=221902 RepID=UPI003CF3689A
MFTNNATANATNNPYRCRIQEILSALVCYDNDYQRISIEIKNAQEKHKLELEQIIFNCSTKQRLQCSHQHEQQRLEKDFPKKVQDVDKMKEAFNKRLNTLTNERQDIFETAKKCFEEMQQYKIQHQRYHLNGINDLKKMVLEAGSKQSRDEFQKDIQEMNKLFINDVEYVEKCERVLKPFIQLLRTTDVRVPKAYCNLKELGGPSKAKSFQEVFEIEQNIKSSMGGVLTKLLAMIHLYQPTDVKSFAANYLMHLKHIDDVVRKKLESIESNKID